MDIDALIAKYLKKEATPGEVDELNRWKSSSSENETIFRQSEDAWRLVHADRSYVRPNKANAWKGIQQRIAQQYSLSMLVKVSAVAASVALIFGLTAVYFFTGQNTTSKQPQKITLYVPGGVCSKVVLPDSSTVWLNSSSTISYPSRFDGDNRTVELIGEAFFDVTPDNDKPFIINSGVLRVNVLGTSFNFKHYEEDTHAVVSVETGVVTLSAGSSVITTLDAGKYATVDNQTLHTKVYNPQPDVISSKKTDPASSTTPKMIAKDVYTDQFSSWRDYKMVFREEAFSNVLNELSRRYNAEFEILGDEIEDYVYTATFDDISLEDVLKLLKLSAPIDYRIKTITSNTINAYGKRKVTIFQK